MYPATQATQPPTVCKMGSEYQPMSSGIVVWVGRYTQVWHDTGHASQTVVYIRDGNQLGRLALVASRLGLLVGSGDRCMTSQPHKMQKNTFSKYKPKTEIHLLQSFRFFYFFYI